jgi:hypothetical protein
VKISWQNSYLANPKHYRNNYISVCPSLPNVNLGGHACIVAIVLHKVAQEARREEAKSVGPDMLKKANHPQTVCYGVPRITQKNIVVPRLIFGIPDSLHVLYDHSTIVPSENSTLNPPSQHI